MQFWKSSADAILGTSAAVSSVTQDTPAYGLKTADISSCTLVGLAARARLLEQKARYKYQEQPYQITSKTLLRHIPGKTLMGGDIQEQVDHDVQVVKNNAPKGPNMDALIGGIYGLNGGD